jgi:membrane protein
VLSLVLWMLGSYLLRWLLTLTAGESTSIYGPLAAPIVVMLWLYLLSIAVLIGAAVNAAFDRVWPESETARARLEMVRKLRLKAMLPRLRRLQEENEKFPDVVEDTVVLTRYDEGREHDEAAEARDEPRPGTLPARAGRRRRT